jgi:DNA repair protein RadC
MNLAMLPCEHLERILLADATQTPMCADSASAAYLPGPHVDRMLLAQRLGAARELLLRDAHRNMMGTSMLDSPNATREYLRLHFSSLPSEVFIAIYLDVHRRVIECCELFRGTLSQCRVYPREVVRSALACNADAVVFAHQHPSSRNPMPTREDELMTQAMKTGLAFVDVRVIDHLVYGGGEFISMAEKGLL